ncbi:MAG: hypothetical protein ACRDWH_01815, partial [Acidimicrobiia bacterium]
IVRQVIIPLAIGAVLTGLLISLVTRWGLFRHYWVVISLLLTVIATLVLLFETRTVGLLATTAADPATSVGDLRASGSTLVHSIGGLMVLVVILVLNVYKPQGMTRYGWRKQREREAGAMGGEGPFRTEQHEDLDQAPQ